MEINVEGLSLELSSFGGQIALADQTKSEYRKKDTTL